MVLKWYNRKKEQKKHFSGIRFRVFFLIVLFGAGLFFEGCAAQRCDCTDLNQRYKPPKKVHRSQRY